MKEHTVKVLEYKKIIEQLTSYASSMAGKELVANLEPSTDWKHIEERLKETSEARRMLDEKLNIPFGGIRDIREIMLRAEKGMVLSGQELLDVSSTLFAGRRLKKFFLEVEDMWRLGANPYHRILLLAKHINTFQPTEDVINNSIDNSGEVLDSASAKLRSLRTKIKTVGGRVKDKLDSYLTSGTYQKMIQDAIVTIRGDRYVIPVKSEYKSSFSGIVHDRSSSGATLFIEPMAVVQMNNQLRQLMAEEEDEVYRILKELTAKVALDYDLIMVTVKILAELDFIFAKAHYSRKLKASEPLVNEQGLVKLKQARHPLLTVKPVPIDVSVGDGFNTLVITGPNTGGKTVTLKTVGLLTLMMQSGLHIPADAGSELAIFRGIYADIGDEQSIEQSLSTFSSHMTKIIDILQQAEKKDLVLLDELGAGTDPSEGASLAMAIMDYLHKREIRTIATTHYSELKTYAYSEAGVENASVEFDLSTLSPTYRLIMGIPGRSNALEIAFRLGLPKSIVDVARSGLSADEAVVDQMIKDIEENNLLSQRESLEAQRLKLQMERLKADYEQHLQKLADKKTEIIDKAIEEAREIVSSSRDEVKDLIKKARLLDMNNLEQVNLELKQKFTEMDNRLSQKRSGRKMGDSHQIPDKLELGDLVKIVTLNQKGEILEILNDEEYVVQVGIMKITVQKKDLAKITKTQENVEKQRITKISRSKASTVRPSLDLRGTRYEEARERTDKYLDDVYLAGLKIVEIIHGKGTGALREGIHDLLRGHPHVAEFRLGNEGEGGIGVTIVKLKA